MGGGERKGPSQREMITKFRTPETRGGAKKKEGKPVSKERVLQLGNEKVLCRGGKERKGTVSNRKKRIARW